MITVNNKHANKMEKSLEMKIAEAVAIKRAIKEQTFPKTIELMAPRGILDTYCSNDEIFAAFCLEEVISDSQENWLECAKKEDAVYIEKIQGAYATAENISRLSSEFEYNLPEIFNRGRVVIFSKIDNKFVNEIKRDKWGVYGGPLMGWGGYGYYLPDGSIFFRVQTWVR